jgi:hypothetical protein
MHWFIVCMLRRQGTLIDKRLLVYPYFSLVLYSYKYRLTSASS